MGVWWATREGFRAGEAEHPGNVELTGVGVGTGKNYGTH